MDFDGRAGLRWGIYGVPETFVIDASGRVVLRHAGPIFKDTLETSSSRNWNKCDDPSSHRAHPHLLWQPALALTPEEQLDNPIWKNARAASHNSSAVLFARTSRLTTQTLTLPVTLE